uniref:Uncharacterized protein n=1 Tax=Meloidogyne javanica TaxID=6303 RepID=A0A915N0G6_MELJA
MTIYARELKERMREAHSRVKNKLDLNVEKMKRLQKSIKTIDWKEGDLVVEKPNLVLEDPESGERKTIHMDKCKPYRRDIDPKEPDNVGEITESEEEDGRKITPTREPVKIVVEEKVNSGSTLEEKKKKLMEELEALKAEEEKEEQKRKEEEEEKKRQEENRVKETQKEKADFEWAQKLWENESRALKIYEELRKVRKLWEEKLEEEEKEKWQKIKKSEN